LDSVMDPNNYVGRSREIVDEIVG